MPRDRINILVGLVGSILCGLAAAQSPVEVARVTLAEITLGQRVVGSVQPLRSSTIGSAADGRVQEFSVNNGDRVTKGQQLAQLRPETLQIQLAAAEAEMDLMQHQLSELENGSLPETIREAEANMLAARALRDNAVNKLRRLVSLSQSRAASDADLEDAQERADATKFAFMAAEAALKRVKDGPRVELIAQAQARVELQAQQVNLLKDQIEKLTIRAPFTGFVSAEFTEVGAWISRGDPIAEVVELSEVEVQVPVTAEHAANLRHGDSIRVEFPEFPERLFVGTVDRIVPVAESRARTFPVYVRMDNPMHGEKPMLMSGMLARAELPGGRRAIMPLVPKDALVLNGAERFVFVLQDVTSGDGDRLTPGTTAKVRRVAVDLGVAVGGLIQVRGDLQEHDWVVVLGNERLMPASEVTVVELRTSAEATQTSSPVTE